MEKKFFFLQAPARPTAQPASSLDSSQGEEAKEERAGPQGAEQSWDTVLGSEGAWAGQGVPRESFNPLKMVATFVKAPLGGRGEELGAIIRHPHGG